MFVSRSLHANHADLIHDVAYDFYGLRMATCSSDQMIKIWDLDGDGEWVCTARWRCHLGSAWRVAWAHPEFGQVIATCSFDRTIVIWEEITNSQSTGCLPSYDPDAQPPGTLVATSTSHSSAPLSAMTSWVRRANLVDPRTSVTGLQFAPRHLGLQLAAISTDGLLRIYEALDVMNLTQWRLQFDFGTKMNGSCLAWSQSRFDPPLIAVGSSLSNSQITTRESGDMSSSVISQSTQSALGQSGGSLVSGKVVIYEYNEGRRHWDLVEDVRALEDAVYDLQFAPHMGQSFHTLAVGSKEVFILRIRTANGQTVNKPPKGNSLVNNESSSFSSANTTTRGAYEIHLLARFDHHKGRVWRVSWNVTGSILASSGDDGYVRLWQANHLGIWHPISVIAPDGSQPATGPLEDSSGVNLATMMPQLPPPARSVGTGLQLKPGAFAEGDQNKPTFERPPIGPMASFQQAGAFANGSHPVAWH